jgi:hypothetical protein
MFYIRREKNSSDVLLMRPKTRYRFELGFLALLDKAPDVNVSLIKSSETHFVYLKVYNIASMSVTY